MKLSIRQNIGDILINYDVTYFKMKLMSAISIKVTKQSLTMWALII